MLVEDLAAAATLAAKDLLERAGQGPLAEPITALAALNRIAVRITIAERPIRDDPPDQPLLNRTDRRILEEMAKLPPDQWIHSHELALLTGYECNGRFRERLSRLVKLERLRSSREGYRLLTPSPR